jgi:hypothetical protein
MGEGEYYSRAREYVRIMITESQPWPMARENDTACRRSRIECWIYNSIKPGKENGLRAKCYVMLALRRLVMCK